MVRELAARRASYLTSRDHGAGCANRQHGRATSGQICVATGGMPTALVVPTDEELSIARDTIRLISTP